MLTIVSSVWTTSMALCLSPIPDAVYQPFATVSGTFASVPIPCEPIDEYPCPACLTLALQTSDRLYYLTADNADIQTQLEAIEYQLSLSIDITGSVSGTPYTEESYEYIRVQAVDTNSAPLRLPSLCDEWNVWYESFESYGPVNFNQVVKYQLTTDTLINGQQYVKLTSGKDYPYCGAMREGTNADIYYVPSGSTHEYLLYAFNAQEGDQLNNVWLGGNPEDYPYGWTMTVEAIQETNPRTFVLSTGFITTEEGVENYPLYTTWIEGVGFSRTPYEIDELPSSLADIGVHTLLCAYKNGEHIYVSKMGAEYGCEHDQTPETTDTIPLYSYTGDDPGSSTIDPVDPNQVVATLNGDQLTIHENTGVDVTYSLQHNAPDQMPLQNRAPLSDTFRNEVTIQISESGEYMLQLTNPSWGYTIFGQFNYEPQGIDRISGAPSLTTIKVIKDGRILILRGDKTYTLTGQEVK